MKGGGKKAIEQKERERIPGADGEGKKTVERKEPVGWKGRKSKRIKKARKHRENLKWKRKKQKK